MHKKSIILPFSFNQPKIVEALIGNAVTGVACGSYHVVVVANDNEVFSWGKGDNGMF